MTAAPLTLDAVLRDLVTPQTVAVLRILPMTPEERRTLAVELPMYRVDVVAHGRPVACRLVVAGGAMVCTTHGATCPAREAIAALTETCHPTEDR